MLRVSLIASLLTCIQLVLGLKSINMNVPSSMYCGAGTTEIDGAVIQSVPGMQYVNSVCNIKLKTAGDKFGTERFMIHFEEFSIKNCGVTLKLYFSADSTGTPAVTLTCGSSLPGPDTSQTTANYLSLRMEIKSLQGNDDFKFRIVVTAFKDIFAGYCTDFACSGKCISNDLRCDGINNCFDQSDEQGCGSYLQTNPYAIGYEATVGIIAGCIAFVVLLVIIGIIIAKVVVDKRRQQDVRRRVITNPGDISVASSHAQQQQYKYGIPHTARPMLQPAYVPVQQQQLSVTNPYAQPIGYAVPQNQSNSMEKHPYDSPPESESAYNNSGKSGKSRLV